MNNWERSQITGHRTMLFFILVFSVSKSYLSSIKWQNNMGENKKCLIAGSSKNDYTLLICFIGLPSPFGWGKFFKKLILTQMLFLDHFQKPYNQFLT